MARRYTNSILLVASLVPHLSPLRSSLQKGTDLLANCKALFCLNAPHLEKIGAHAFENCAYLTGTVMKNVKIFEDRAFYFCRRQATTYFPQVQTFGERGKERDWARKQGQGVQERTKRPGRRLVVQN